ncbi:MAG TPA: histidinol-phosphate transaminase [Polyangiaceae bacterium]|nr:histidinol-phosphate transaminase [Polyangiaceae bacterium]
MTEFPLSDLLRPELAELKPYLPTLGDFHVRLDANEAPPLFPGHVRDRLQQALSEVECERYPDPLMAELRAAIARHTGVSSEEVLAGVGSDEIISLLLTVLARPRPGSDAASIVTTTPSFVMYKLSARVRGQRVLEVPLDAEWDIAGEALVRAIEFGQPHVVFIASPNNPTGTMASRDRLAKVIEAAPSSLVVVDEAYVDYADRDQLDLYRRYPNVALLRTLSKIGFAALRVGWLVARPELVAEVDKARLPYNLNSYSQKVATLALSELGPAIKTVLGTVIGERERLAAELAKLPGLIVTPSQANFLWFRSERPASEVFSGLCARKVLVRSFHERGGRLAHQLRVTIGTPEENDEFLRCLREVM